MKSNAGRKKMSTIQKSFSRLIRETWKAVRKSKENCEKKRQEVIRQEVRGIILTRYLKSDLLDQKVQKNVSSDEKWNRAKGDCEQM